MTFASTAWPLLVLAIEAVARKTESSELEENSEHISKPCRACSREVGRWGTLGGGTESDTDDFGRLSPSRPGMFSSGKKSSATLGVATRPLDKAARQRTISNPNLAAAAATERPSTPGFPFSDAQDGFLATNLEPALHPTDEFGLPKPPATKPTQEYGYLHWEKHIILGLDEVVRLVDVVAEELRQRGTLTILIPAKSPRCSRRFPCSGLTTPLLFSPMALDINPNTIRKLVQAFLATCPHDKALSITDYQWREEAKFAGPHELAMLLRWGLARIVRVEGNVELRGFLSFENYVHWRRAEEGNALFLIPVSMSGHSY